MRRSILTIFLPLAVAAAVVAVAACGSTEESRSGGDAAPTVGFLYVGPTNDLGFNEAAHRGAMQLKRTIPGIKILEAENVPETAQAAQVMNSMIDRGAKLLFPTSFGHLEPALGVARQHPDVTIMHLGGLKQSKNLGAYAANATQAQFLGGMAAGMATNSDKLGYVVAFPISPTLQLVDAFELGARAVNPKATTRVIFTNNWCDPGKQVEAVNALADQKVDVISQHQDCTETVIKAAEKRGVMSVGFNFDASQVARKGWLTGSVWNWGPLYTKIVRTYETNGWKRAPFGPGRRYVASMKDGTVQLAPFGPAATPDIRQRVRQAQQQILAGKLDPFTGPITDQSGKVRVPKGHTLTPAEADQINYFVTGVIGNSR
jgi:basic membrane protein A and related proteins